MLGFDPLPLPVQSKANSWVTLGFIEASAPRLPLNFMVGKSKCRMALKNGKIPLIVLYSNSKQLLQCRQDVPGSFKFMMGLAEKLKGGQVALGDVKQERQKWLEVHV